MIELQIPVQPLIFCAGNIVGVLACVLFAAWLNRRQKKQVLDGLSGLQVEFTKGEGDASTDEVDQC
jgi:hypothetical protein